MSSFKVKNKKKIVSNQRSTLDAEHNEKLNQFSKDSQNIDILKQQLTNSENEFSKISNKAKSELSEYELDRFFTLRDEIPKLKEKVTNIENSIDENEYFLNTGDILFKYYETIEDTNKTRANITSITSYLNCNSNNSNSNNSSNYNTENKSRAQILDNYLSIVKENHNKEFVSNNTNLNNNRCPYCENEEMILNQTEALYECVKCGNTHFTIIDSDKPSYKEPPREVSYFAYKRINHFNEWLAQFQAKESTEIPKDVFDLIWIEIKKERITNMANLTTNKVREILKKIRLNKYYEHVPHIINRLNGLPAPIMTRETEEKLRSMFKEIQIPFIKHCPKERKNFLSYSYVLHKFVQLLGYDHYLVNFPLLKSREKLHQQDTIWKEICKDLSWEFIRSV
jgi:ribosomal protein S27E